MAYAAFEFTDKIIAALGGKTGIIVPSYVNLSLPGGDAIKKEIGEDLEYFSAPVELGVCFLYLFIHSFHALILRPSPRV